jgi:NADH-quinone oxidoreductase subunit A
MFYAFCLFFLATFLFAGLLFCISTLLTYKTLPNVEKFDLYECGFKSFDSARQPMHINYFLIAILFVIFDIETVYLIPWLMNFSFLNYSSLYGVLFFIILLIAGYIYELKEGLLDWATTTF